MAMPIIIDYDSDQQKARQARIERIFGLPEGAPITKEWSLSSEAKNTARLDVSLVAFIDIEETNAILNGVPLAVGTPKPVNLDTLAVGSVVLVFDPRAGDWNAWQLFDDVQELRDESGEKADIAWASAAYKVEHSCDSLRSFAVVPENIRLLFEAGVA